MAAVAARVLPSYKGRIVYVDAITDDPAAQDVLQRYPTSYIPTSVFLNAAGDVVDTFIGPLSEAQLRQKLDALAE
jgi:thioredoxin-like negative regulator of GroEL